MNIFGLETTVCKSTQNGGLFPIGHDLSIRIPLKKLKFDYTRQKSK